MEKGEIPAFGLRSAVEACKHGLRRNTEKVQSIVSSVFRDFRWYSKRKVLELELRKSGRLNRKYL